MSKSKRSNGTEVTTFNLSLPSTLVQELDSRRGKTPRTAVIEAAVRAYLDATNEDNLSRHLLNLDLDDAAQLEAYRRVTDGPPISNIAVSAINRYVGSKLEGNGRLQQEFADELAQIRRELKPPLTIVGD